MRSQVSLGFFVDLLISYLQVRTGIKGALLPKDTIGAIIDP
jgi:hypothetical protein